MIVAAEPVVDLPELAHDWFGLATWAIIGCAVVAAAVLWIKHGLDTQSALKKVGTSVAAVAHSVNNRPDTTRDQLDRIERRQNEMAGDMRGMKRDVGRLADAAVDDRAMHHQDVERLEVDIDELRRRLS